MIFSKKKFKNETNAMVLEKPLIFCSPSVCFFCNDYVQTVGKEVRCLPIYVLVYSPKMHEGLGVKKLEVMNQDFIAKLVWRMMTNLSTL